MHRQPLGFLLHHGYIVLFATVLVEQLGAPIPAIPALLAMGALIGTEHYSFSIGMSLALAASVAADSVWYVLGRTKGGSVLKLLCRISLEPDSCVSTARSWFTKLGGWALVLAKFLPGLGAVATPMAGLSRMPWWKFLAADAGGVLAWAGAYIGLGFAFRLQLEEAGAAILGFGASLAGVVAGCLALWIAWKYWQRRRFIRSLRVARIQPEELMQRLKEVVLIDLRAAAEVEDKLPGALWLDKAELEQRHQEIPRDRDVVLYCT